MANIKKISIGGNIYDLKDGRFDTVLTGGSLTTTSNADGGSNVYTFTKSDNTTSTLTVKNGSKGSKGDRGTIFFTSSIIRTVTNNTWNTYKLSNRINTWSNGTVDGMRVGDILVLPFILSEQDNIQGLIFTEILSVPTSKDLSSNFYSIQCKTLYYLVGQKGAKGDPGTNATTTSVATTSANGLMSSSDKTKLDGLNNPTTSTTYTSTPAANTVYNLGTRTSLSITTTPNSSLETRIYFTAGSSISVSIPSSSKVVGTWNFEEGNSYVISILDGVYIMGEIKVN